MSNRQIGDFLNASKRLENPHGSRLGPDYAGAKRDYPVTCPQNLYEICLDCWNHEVRSEHFPPSLCGSRRPVGASWRLTVTAPLEILHAA